MIFKSFLNRLKFNKICRDIKNIKIQGARNIARKALEAYLLFPTRESKEKLISLRPTEPMLQRVLEEASKKSPSSLISHFDFAQEKINFFANRIIKNSDVIFTHCHSSNVVNALIYSKKKRKKFEVYNSETRPLFQGRKTSEELSNAGIKVTQFTDSAFGVALSLEQGTKKVTKVFLGADAITKKGVINKIGSGTIAKLACLEGIPIYILADSWKFTKKDLPLEQRDLNEIWDKAPKKVKIKNPAFEFIDIKYVKGIISELGNLIPKEFFKKVN
jgi:ribose 1,5-bisphosphate isomerase